MAAEKPAGKPGRKATVWTEEETVRLAVLNERFKDDRFPNVRIREFFPDKGLKQISDKRRALPITRPQAVVRAASESNSEEDIAGVEVVEDAVAIDEGDGNQRVADERDTEQATRMTTEGHGTTETEWKDRLKVYVLSINLDDHAELAQWGREADHWLSSYKEVTDEEISQLVRNLTSLINPPNNQGYHDDKAGGNKGRKKDKRNRRGPNHNQRARYSFARCQELYHKCPKKLVDMAVSGQLDFAEKRQTSPSVEEIRRLYEPLWGAAGPDRVVYTGVAHTDEIPSDLVYSPITVQELVDKMKKVKATSAPGRDGVKKTHLKSQGILSAVAKLFNILLLTEKYPVEWKSNRTTLIPKPGKDAARVENWRPITISSLLGRMFSAMIDFRLRKNVKQSARQKGFTSEDGCKNNIYLLKSVLTRMKTDQGGVVTIVDVSKAFDTVPHSAIVSSLKLKGIPAPLALHIREMYNGSKTFIRAENNKEVEVACNRGVKQGDPLSPLLFNLALEPLIQKISEETEGIRFGEKNLAILAFADDIVLVAKNRAEADRQILKLDKYLQMLGMSLSIDKCSTFQIITAHKTWYLKDPELRVRGTGIPNTEPEEILSYLGAAMGPWKGFERGQTVSILVAAAQKIAKMKLKPHQKIELLRVHLLPRYIHGLVASPPPMGRLIELDQEIRQIVKKILKLQPSTTDGIIYSAKSHGGLGFPKMENIVKVAAIRSVLKMQISTDSIVQSAANEQSKLMEQYAQSIGLVWPPTMDSVELTRKRLRRIETDKWRQLITQGHGVADFTNDRIGNTWLYQPTLLKPSRYIDALKLRTNTFGTRMAMKRANPQLNDSCRRCGEKRETLGHILGECTHTKHKRIHRHDEIKNLIAEKVSKHSTVFVEPNVNVIGDLKKPDLVIKDQERIFIVDVTVRYEYRNNLKLAVREKEAKYKDTAEYIRIKTGGTSATVLPIVVGSRGAMPIETKGHLMKLGLAKKDLITISMIALRSSIEMANQFIDYD